jgi:hypothetical protein
MVSLDSETDSDIQEAQGEVIVFGSRDGAAAKATAGGRKSTRKKTTRLRAKRTPASLKRAARKRKLPTKAQVGAGARKRKKG